VAASGSISGVLQDAATRATKQLSVGLLLKAKPTITLTFARRIDGLLAVTVHSGHRVLARGRSMIAGTRTTVALTDAKGARAWLRAQRQAHYRPAMTIDLALKRDA